MKDPKEWIETAWEYEMAVECEIGDTVHGYFRSIDGRVSHHNWFRIEPEQNRWGLVTEAAVMNAIENSQPNVRLREPDSLLAEIETE